PGRLRQVLINVIGNAVKFTDSGEVVVRAKRNESRGPGIAIHFEVVDTGEGLTEEEAGRVFAVYSQLDSSTTRRHGGTGLGLAIVGLMMPEMDGAAVAAAMRSDAALQDLAVILLTSAGKSERDMPGVDAEMVKPVRPSQLFDVLHTLLAGRSGRAPVEPAPH